MSPAYVSIFLGLHVYGLGHVLGTSIPFAFKGKNVIDPSIPTGEKFVGKSVTSGERDIVLMRPWSGETGREVE